MISIEDIYEKIILERQTDFRFIMYISLLRPVKLYRKADQQGTIFFGESDIHSQWIRTTEQHFSGSVSRSSKSTPRNRFPFQRDFQAFQETAKQKAKFGSCFVYWLRFDMDNAELQKTFLDQMSLLYEKFDLIRYLDNRPKFLSETSLPMISKGAKSRNKRKPERYNEFRNIKQVKTIQIIDPYKQNLSFDILLCLECLFSFNILQKETLTQHFYDSLKSEPHCKTIVALELMLHGSRMHILNHVSVFKSKIAEILRRKIKCDEYFSKCLYIVSTY